MMVKTVKWLLDGTYNSDIVTETAIAQITDERNAKSTRFVYRYRAAHYSNDWVLEYRKA